MNNLPQIRIKDGWLLRDNVSRHLHELWSKGEPLEDDKWMAKRVKEYQAAWRPQEKKIVRGMCELLDLEFYQDVIDVYIAPWFNALSDPLIIGVSRTPEEFVDTLTHELIHKLLTDNKTVPSTTELVKPWEKLFGKDHSFNALVHIPVHAVHKAMYLDVLKDQRRLERDIATDKTYSATDYVNAWNYVNEHDYKVLIDGLKQTYKSLSDV